jgi:hypothetical protein
VRLLCRRYNSLTAMPVGSYEIRAKADSLDVRWRGPASYRVLGALAIAGGLANAYFDAVGRGHSPGIWVTLLHSRPGANGFVSTAIMAGVSLAFVTFLPSLGLRYLLPFRETLHCDRTELIWSRTPWVSFGNRWVTRSAPLSEICNARYGIVYRSKNVHGILLETYGETWKMFWQIESPEANRILHGLKALGVKVQHDPEMREGIREALRDRRAQL